MDIIIGVGIWKNAFNVLDKPNVFMVMEDRGNKQTKSVRYFEDNMLLRLFLKRKILNVYCFMFLRKNY